MYFNGIYEFNNPAHVKGNPQEIVEPQNYYAYIMQKGLAKEKIRRRGDPVDDIPAIKYDKKPNKKTQSMDMRQMRQPQLSKFKQFEIHYNRMQVEKIAGPKMADLNSYIDEFTAKSETKEYQQSFLHFRRNIDRLLDAGYHVIDEEKEGHLYKQTNLTSCIEKIVEER